MKARDAADLGLLLRAARKKAGLTQRQLAQLAGVSPRLLVELEGGRPSVGIGLVLRVLATLGLDLHVLGRGEPTPSEPGAPVVAGADDGASADGGRDASSAVGSSRSPAGKVP